MDKMKSLGLSQPQGDRIEDYDRLNLLGKGAFASVYRARCRITGIYVAIKMIDKHLMKMNRMTDRVKQEANIHQRLSHPAILQLFRFFEDPNFIYLVLELAEYGDIQNYLSVNNIQVTEAETAIIMKQIVDGLMYLHANNILHRDMKLPNLLVTSDMKVKIADFGLATQLTRPDEKHMTMCGTPNYISPEVAARVSHGLPADIWGLGIMMYTLLVGRPPFDTDAVASTLKKVISSDIMIPMSMSPDARDLLGRLLQKDQMVRIRLDEVLRHSFMTKYNGISTAATDSGVLTMSSTSSPNISTPRSLQRTRSADPYRYQLQQEPIRETSELFNTDKMHMPLYDGHRHVESGYTDTYSSNTANVNAAGYEPNRFGSLVMRSASAQEHSVYRDYGDRQPTHYSDNVTDMHVRPNDPGGGRFFPLPQSTPKYKKENMKPSEQYYVKSALIQNILQREEMKKIDVPRFNAERLMPTRYKTKNAILTVDNQSNVIIELIKYKTKYQEDRIVDMCRISRDGGRIETYQPDPGRGIKIQETTPSFTADAVYEYDLLPERHWKKYTYASRFVQLVRAKTPKITYFSPKAKCSLMETLEDFEMFFYDGAEKFFKSPSNGITFVDQQGRTIQVPSTFQANDYAQEGPSQMFWEHFQHCLNHCITLERSLKMIPTDGDIFPNTAGRRPLLAPIKQSSNINDTDSCTNIMMTPKTPAMRSYSHSVASSNASSSRQVPPSSIQSKLPAALCVSSGRVLVPGIGIATKSSQGVLEVQYNDDTQLSVLPKEQGGGFIFRKCVSEGGIPMRYTINDELPELVRVRLEQIPVVLKHLAQNEALNTPVTSKKANPMRFCR